MSCKYIPLILNPRPNLSHPPPRPPSPPPPQEPENIDKEFLRLWFRDNCDPYHDKVLPEAPKELVSELSRRYILLYEMITGQKFTVSDASMEPNERMKKNLHNHRLL